MYRTTTSDLEVICRFNRVQNTENIQLIWCDACCVDTTHITNIEINSDVQTTKAMLSGLSRSVRFFDNCEECIESIKSTENNINIILVISGSYASVVLSAVHHLRPLSFVFIFCQSANTYSGLLSQYSKIVNIYTEQAELQLGISKKIDLLEQQALQFIVFNRQQKSIRDLTENTVESLMFIFHSVLLDILKRMPADEYAKQQLIDTCEKYYCNSKHDLIMIERFRATFKPEDAIKWYTTNCFLFRLLNRALRTEDVNLLFAFRFYIIVLCKALANEKQKLLSNTDLKLFRGQKMAVTEFESLQKRIGSFITTNGFLSTSLDADVALMFAGHGAPCPESYCIILFEIQVNASVESVIFASIDNDSDFIDEKEVLFSLNTEFKIESINYDDQRQLWIVRLVASSDGSRYVNEFIESARIEEKSFFTPLTYYGHIIWYEFQQLDEAEKYFQILMKTLPADHSELSIIYYELGCLYQKKKDWFAALQNLTCARNLLSTSENERNELIAMVWLTMGEVYYATGDLDESLNLLQRALSLWDLDHSHLRKARTLECISKVYELRDPKHYQEIILDNYNKALDIYQCNLSLCNDKLKNCLQNIGHFHDTIGEYDHGLEYYKRALAMQLYQPCEDTDTFLGSLYLLIKSLKKRIVEFESIKTQESAFMLLNEIMNIRIRTLGENEDHPHIAIIIGSMGDLCEDTQSFVKTAYYELAVTKLELNSGSSEILDRLVQYIEKLCSIYEKTNDYDNALKCLKRKLILQQQHYPSHDMNIVHTLSQMGFLYQKTARHSSMAFYYFSQALTLYNSVEREDDTQDMEDNLTQLVMHELMNMRDTTS